MPTIIRKKEEEILPNTTIPLTRLLSLRIPRCSVCELDWLVDVDVNNKQNNRIDRLSDKQLREKCQQLIPVPCQCSTIMFVDSSTASTTSDTFDQILSQAKKAANLKNISQALVDKFFCQCDDEPLKEYHQRGICSDCLQRFISAADDVMEHDYRCTETQPNPKYSVGLNCPHCRKHFHARGLQRALHNTTNSTSDWVKHVQATIRFILFTKQLKCILLSSPLGNNIAERPSSDEIEPVEENEESIRKWLADNDNGDDDDTLMTTGPLKKKARTATMVAPAEGELKKQLMEKDQRFRQEVEDLEYIQKLMKTEEGRRMFGYDVGRQQTQEEIDRDEALARELANKDQATAGEKRSSVKSASTKSPMRRYLSNKKIESSNQPKICRVSETGRTSREIGRPKITRNEKSESDNSKRVNNTANPAVASSTSFVKTNLNNVKKDNFPGNTVAVLDLIDESTSESSSSDPDSSDSNTAKTEKNKKEISKRVNNAANRAVSSSASLKENVTNVKKKNIPGNTVDLVGESTSESDSSDSDSSDSNTEKNKEKSKAEISKRVNNVVNPANASSISCLQEQNKKQGGRMNVSGKSVAVVDLIDDNTSNDSDTSDSSEENRGNITGEKKVSSMKSAMQEIIPSNKKIKSNETKMFFRDCFTRKY